MASKRHGRLANYSVIPEGSLLFDPTNEKVSAPHPLRGLVEHGPFGAKLSPAIVSPPIRIAYVTIEGYATTLRDHLNRLEQGFRSTAKSGYFPEYPGFQKVYGVPLSIPQSRREPVSLISETAARTALSHTEPERAFLPLLERAVTALTIRRAEFDIIVFYLPQFLAPIFKVYGEGYEFDLHDATKAITATLGIPSQVVLDRSIDYADTCSVMWSLSLALYAKAGGIPWKLNNAAPEGTAFIGLSYVLRRQEGRQSVLTCCSQLFDSQGHGLQFLLFSADEFRFISRNPFLTKQGMRRLLSKTLELYARQLGNLPRYVVVHKTTQYTRDEREGAAEALGDLTGYELLQVQEGTSWLAAKGKRGEATPYPVDRGTVLPLTKFSFLLWTQGDVWGATERNKSFYQEAKGVPHPLLITQHAGESDMLDSAAQLLALTRMNWNTGRLYNALPVTVRSASALGDIAKYMGKHSTAPYQYRLFM